MPSADRSGAKTKYPAACGATVSGLYEARLCADMGIYSMVKNNIFNGMLLPTIALREQSRECRIVRQFGYRDFKGRL